MIKVIIHDSRSLFSRVITRFFAFTTACLRVFSPSYGVSYHSSTHGQNNRVYIHKHSQRQPCTLYAPVESRGRVHPDVEPLPHAAQAGPGPERSSVRCCVVQRGQLITGFNDGTHNEQRKLDKPTGPTRTRAGRTSRVRFCGRRRPYCERVIMFIVLPTT
jgi:hypothetical protein